MAKRRFVIITAFIMTLFLCTETLTVSAASLSEITKNIKQKQAELNEGKAKESSLSSQVNALEGKINSAQSNIDKLETAIAEAEADLTVLEGELEEAEAKVSTQNDNLGSRLRNMYKNGSVGFLDVLMDSNSFSEFLTNLDLVEKVYASDQETLTGLQDAYDQIDKKKAEVEALQADLTESKQVAQEEKAALVTDKAALTKQKEKIAASNEETAKMLDEMEAESRALAAELANSNNVSSSSNSSYGGGALAWPTPGYTYITSNYGWRICPFHGSEFHAGIDIGASGGSPVVSAASGTVYKAGWNSGGFGYQVIVDHGGGMTTWYNHLSSISVSRGQSVSKGQQVGRVGSTGSSTGNHLDYRVFVNGSSKNPMSYY